MGRDMGHDSASFTGPLHGRPYACSQLQGLTAVAQELGTLRGLWLHCMASGRLVLGLRSSAEMHLATHISALRCCVSCRC